MGRSTRTRAGNLRQRVLLQQVTPTVDSYGETVEVWTDYKRAWCRIEPLMGKELLDARQLTADVTHRVTMRNRDDVTEKMRINLNGRVLHVATAPIRLDERNEFIQMDAIEQK